MIRQGDIPGVQLRRRQDLAVPAEEAWRWLVEPAKLALWLAREAEVVEGEGGSLLTGTGDPGRRAGAGASAGARWSSRRPGSG